MSATSETSKRSKTVVVTVTDAPYYERAKRTIIDARSRGEWRGDIVLITIGFSPSRNFLDYYNVTERRYDHVDVKNLVEQYRQFPLKTVSDNRHVLKLAQWNKLYVFDTWFKQWNKVIFFDSGLRIFDKVSILDELKCDGKILAPDDAPPNNTDKRFRVQVELTANPEAAKRLLTEHSESILDGRYFLNCIWVYDTSLLSICNVSHLIEEMNKYPICRCNEMTLMNLLFTFKHKVWEAFPEFIDNGKRLFGWVDYEPDPRKTWRDYCFIKYPATINMACE